MKMIRHRKSKKSKNIEQTELSFSFLEGIASNYISEALNGRIPKKKKTFDPSYHILKPLWITSEWKEVMIKTNNDPFKKKLVIKIVIDAIKKISPKSMRNALKKVLNKLNESKLGSDFNFDINNFYKKFNTKYEHTLDNLLKEIENYVEYNKDSKTITQSYKNIKKILSTITGKSLRSISRLGLHKIIKNSDLDTLKTPENEEKFENLADELNYIKSVNKIIIDYLLKFIQSNYKEKDQKLDNLLKTFSELEFSKDDKKKDLLSKIDLLSETLWKIYSIIIQNLHIISFSKALENMFNETISDKILNWFELVDTLNSFLPGMGWDLSSGILSQHMIANIMKYSKLIEQIPQIKEIAELLGRLEGYSTLRRKWELKPYIPDEIYDIDKSNDIEHIIPAELIKLTHPKLKLLFYANYIDHNLLTYKFRGYSSESISEKKKERRGPIIICIDTSGSMMGTPENIAKALALAVIKIAKKEKRDVHIILFSSTDEIKEYELLFKKYGKKPESKENIIEFYDAYQKQKIQNYDSILSFLSYGFGGGTDFRTPLKRAKEILEKDEFKQADILFISDGISFTDNILSETINQIKERNARIFTALIGTTKHVVSTFSEQIYQISAMNPIYPESASHLGFLIKKLKNS